jgi:HAD superfamily hydrolase (TIGR01450 family)
MTKFTEKIKLFAFDLDGTLYIGENIVPGAVELINLLRKNYKLVFFTNNSSKTVKQIHQKLNSLGIICKVDEVYTSSSVALLYFREENIDNLYVIGSKSFCNEIKKNGLKVVDADLAENLVVGLDFDFNYKKIANALSVLMKGGRFIACNIDCSFPTGESILSPGCGAMVGAITGAANKKPDFIVGKPNTYMLAKISEYFTVSNNEIIVVGDSFESDIKMALSYNCKAILINSHSLENQNVLIMKNLNEIIKFISGELKNECFRI